MARIGIIGAGAFGTAMACVLRRASVRRAFAPTSPMTSSARQETFTGLSGVGDLNLCSNSPASRNMSLGIALGQGRKLADVLAERITVQEGVHSAESVAALARSHALDMPIAQAVDRILNHDADIDTTITHLLARPCGLERVSAGP